MNYIKEENEKAYNFLTEKGFELVKASQVVYTDSYYNRVDEGWIDAAQYSTHPCYDEYASLVAVTHIWIIKNWKGNSRAFHRYMKENNILLPKYYYLFDKFEKEEQYLVSSILKETILEGIRMSLYDSKILVYEQDGNVIVCILRKDKSSVKFIAEGLDFNKDYYEEEDLDVFTLIQRNTIVLHIINHSKK